MKQPAMSVPPEMLARCTSAFACSYTQEKPALESGDPVDSTVRSEPSRANRRGSSPAALHAWMNRALVPKSVTPSRSTMRQSVSSVGCDGDPS